MKYSVIGYFLSEGFRNVFKNKKSTISCLGIMCVTMLMFGLFFAIGRNITHMVENIEDAQAIRAFFYEDAPEDEVIALKDQILAIDGVADVKYRNKQDACTVSFIVFAIINIDIAIKELEDFCQRRKEEKYIETELTKNSVQTLKNRLLEIKNTANIKK